MALSVSARLRRYPALVRIKRLIWRGLGLGGRGLNVMHSCPAFAPNSAGSHADLTALTLQAINHTVPQLGALATALGQSVPQPVSVRSLCDTPQAQAAAHQLKALLDRHGSDKADPHDYHYLYGAILHDPHTVSGLLEIGLGSNNRDVVSNMGAAGHPGASLRAWRDFLPAAHIHGADIDRRILFREDRIETHFVDQTDDDALSTLGRLVPDGLDLVIDDGLHAPDANLRTLRFALTKIRPGGWVVIEDIAQDAIPVWQMAALLLPDHYRPHILLADGGVLFAVQSR